MNAGYHGRFKRNLHGVLYYRVFWVICAVQGGSSDVVKHDGLVHRERSEPGKIQFVHNDDTPMSCPYETSIGGDTVYRWEGKRMLKS